jgi:hypothetical protein
MCNQQLNQPQYKKGDLISIRQGQQSVVAEVFGPPKGVDPRYRVKRQDTNQFISVEKGAIIGLVNERTVEAVD